MKSLVLAAALGALALGFPGTAAAATSFEVCTPAGCAVQSVRGTVDRGEVAVTVTDRSPVSALTARFAVSPQGVVTQVIVDDGVKRAVFRLPVGANQLIVTACGSGGCTSKSVPL
ncbi:hypothetical protein [Amycolatopsis sp. EV170708-02-1]|uniref:hypothetical protein n=1 Tax=Amycolatopsis sp. EV170708-02-1 TaxID=2919322 RepID=UPI001F0C5126|nr:hypothetical protein [Amycolatopsis sp. EV170708-02-1]UMP02360.1 hypothetical protein MJQ72_39230 [Amycolatopsis sp. EV170708-02-1]